MLVTYYLNGQLSYQNVVSLLATALAHAVGNKYGTAYSILVDLIHGRSQFVYNVMNAVQNGLTWQVINSLANDLFSIVTIAFPGTTWITIVSVLWDVGTIL